MYGISETAHLTKYDKNPCNFTPEWNGPVKHPALKTPVFIPKYLPYSCVMISAATFEAPKIEWVVLSILIVSLIPFLKKKLIFVEQCGPGKLARQIDILENGFRISDRIDLTQDVKKLYRADKFSLRHVASSKYFSINELNTNEELDWDGASVVTSERFIKWENLIMDDDEKAKA